MILGALKTAAEGTTFLAVTLFMLLSILSALVRAARLVADHVAFAKTLKGAGDPQEHHEAE